MSKSRSPSARGRRVSPRAQSPAVAIPDGHQPGVPRAWAFAFMVIATLLLRGWLVGSLRLDLRTNFAGEPAHAQSKGK
jgi:hypothetical protein